MCIVMCMLPSNLSIYAFTYLVDKVSSFEAADDMKDKLNGFDGALLSGGGAAATGDDVIRGGGSIQCREQLDMWMDGCV